VWATVSASPGGSDTQVQYNDGGAFGGATGFTFNKVTGFATFGAFFYNVAQDYILTAGSGAYPTMVGSRSHFTCRLDTGCVGIIDGGNTFGYTKSRGTRLDVVAGTTDTFSEFSLSGSAVFEQNTTDRNRVFLINRQPFISDIDTGSSSSAIHWTEYYNDPDIYIAPVQRSAYEMGNDYWMGLAPDGTYGERYFNPGTSAYVYPAPRLSWYLRDSVHGLNKLYIDNNRIEGWGYSYQTTQNIRHFLFKEDYRGNEIYIGANSGNEQGDDTYGASIYIGNRAGYNKTVSGSNLLIGHFVGGTATNGSYDCMVGNFAGQVMDGGNNLILGNYAGSYQEVGTSTANNNILIGAGANYAYATGRVIIDQNNRGSVLATKRHALIIGQSSSSAPRSSAQTLYLNAETSVMGLNSVCDRDSGDALFCRNTGQQIFVPAI
jgi:hypothetical protein